MSEPAVSARGNGVRINRVRVGFDMGDSVRSKTTIARFLRHTRPGVGIGAGFHINETLPRDQFPVLGNSSFDLHSSRMAVTVLKLSSMEWASRTGRLAFQDRAAAKGSVFTASLPHRRRRDRAR